MKKIKNVLALLMVFGLVLAFTACSKENSGSPDSDTGSKSDDILPEFDNLTALKKHI